MGKKGCSSSTVTMVKLQTTSSESILILYLIFFLLDTNLVFQHFDSFLIFGLEIWHSAISTLICLSVNILLLLYRCIYTIIKPSCWSWRKRIGRFYGFPKVSLIGYYIDSSTFVFFLFFGL